MIFLEIQNKNAAQDAGGSNYALHKVWKTSIINI